MKPQAARAHGDACSPRYYLTHRRNSTSADYLRVTVMGASDALVNIVITLINDAPIADSQSITPRQSTPVTITLSGSDIESEVLAYSVVIPPENGTLSGTAPNLIYTPMNGFVG